ncbi:hypothetical protein BVC80_521g77 [Macleaya cordata]|uniref:DBH-like monooxygenase n=1 Tax=Macleaya cordata TaxID=56857 RepID=A0A200R981_MACCD|nr:hypothetical protein BVC80_521g77 [Macleaya cordata]
MAGYLSMKMKRKDLEEVYDEFSEFSLSAPARKIRRLDAELPPIMEEEESGVPIDFDQVLPEEQPFSASVTENAPSLSLNEERALVLYNPMNTPLLKSPSSSNFSITVNSDLIPGFKDQVFWSGRRNFLKVHDNEAEHRGDENAGGGNGECLAVVPWVSSQFPSTLGTEVGATTTITTTTGLSEPMEAEEEVDNNEGMEIEVDNNMGVSQGQQEQENIEAGGLQHWKQQQQQQLQHCMSPPQLPQNTSTPIMWSW